MTGTRPRSSTPAVVRAETHDTARLAAVIAEAFEPIAPARALFPDEQDRRILLPQLLRICVEHALEHGTVYTTEDRAAAAVWFRSEGGPPPAPRDYDARLAEVLGPHAPRVRRYDALVAAAHPEAPHDYLWILAVTPHRQCEGIGRLLLDTHHQRLDRRGRTAYLQASDWATRGLYLRLGYRDLDPPHLVLAALGGTVLHRMSRPPGAAAWSPAAGQRVTVKPTARRWAGRTGTVTRVGPWVLDRPVGVALDGEPPVDKQFVPDDLEPDPGASDP